MVGVLLFCRLLAGAPIHAQDAAPPELGVVAGPMDGVYLNDSFEARELLARIQDSAASSDWPRALAQLDELRAQFSRIVYAAAPDRYVSMPSLLNDLILSWPRPGLVAYQNHVGPEAQAALQEAMRNRDGDRLAELVELFFCTPQALEGADLLAQMRLEAGRFAEATDLYRRLLERHPEREAQCTLLQSRLLMCLALAGRLPEAQGLMSEGGEALRDHVMLWQGRPATCGQILAEFQDHHLTPSRAPTGLHWPTFAGQAQRNGISSIPEMPTAPLWVFSDFAPTTLARQDGYFQGSSYRVALERGKFLALFPVAADGRIYFSDARSVWALDQESGALVWNHEALPAGGELAWQDRSVPPLYSCTVADGCVYVELGSRPIAYYGYQPAQNQSLLVCLDARTGRLLWQIAPDALEEDPREVQFEGPVLADHDGVHAIVRRRKAFGFEDCYLWKISPDGQPLWRTHLGSASSGDFGYRRPTLAIPSLIEGRVYVQTNLGTVAAVDAASGIVEWITLYQRPPFDKDYWQRRSGQAFPWEYSPPLPWELEAGAPQNLIIAPLDTTDILVLDRRSGVVTERIGRDTLENAAALLGVIDGRLISVGQKLACWDLRARQMVWSRSLPENPIYGRGALSHTHVFLPCRDGLYCYPLDGGEPVSRPWEPTQEGGNVVALEDRLLVAGNERITAYGLRDQVFARLERRLAESPQDPMPAMDMARVAYRTAASQVDLQAKAADYLRARQALDEALRRAGGLAMLPPEFQAALFADCLRFAGLHLQEDPPQLEAAVELLSLAGQCAPSAQDQLRQRAALAGAYGRLRQPREQLEQYQYILSDRSLRELPWPGDASQAQAGEVCRNLVAELITEHGRDIYSLYDELASTLLAAATAAADVQRLDHILASLPNALAAPQALLAKGRILRTGRQPRAAARCFYAALQRYPHQIAPAETIKELADCYVTAGEPGAAAWWLARGARDHPYERVQHDGQALSLAGYRSALGLQRRANACRLPEVSWPLAPQYELPLPAPGRVLYPEQRRRRDADWARVIIHSPGELRALHPADGHTLWSLGTAGHGPPRLIAALDSCLIFAGAFRVEGRDPQSGRLIWEHGEVPADLDAPETDPENFPQYSLHALTDSTLVSAMTDGQVVCWDLASDTARWRKQLTPRPLRALTAADQSLIYAALQGDTAVIVTASMEDGSVQSVVEPPFPEPVLNLQPTLAGNFLISTTRSLAGFDPLSGRIEWTRSFDESMLLHTARVLIDGVVVCADGMRLIKLNLDDGSTMWESEPLRSQPGDVDLVVERDELYVLLQDMPSPLITVLDLLDGRRLCDLRSRDGDILLAEVTNERLLLGVRTRPLDENPPIHWIAQVPGAGQTDRDLLRSDGLTLGSFSGSVEIYVYDQGIIAHSEGVLHGWGSSTPAHTDEP